MAEHAMLPHIQKHSFRVMEVACWLGHALGEAGFPLRLDLIQAGALLHDLGKTPCLGTAANHAEWGAEVLVGRGYPEVAQIVREHVHLEAQPGEARPFREAEVVNYADKRVLHTQVVTLSARFADLKERYGKSRPDALSRIAAAEQRAQNLEARLFTPLVVSPLDLLQLNDTWREP
jgi:putative nucleotidyltransferase with HDIG domain